MMPTTPPRRPAPRPTGPRFTVGLDLGQAQDFCALSVVERRETPDPVDPTRTAREFAVRHLKRWPLGTPYTDVVADVGALLARDPLPGSPLVVDATGVGRPVVEMLRAGLPKAKLVPVTITGGHAVHLGPAGVGGWSVPKKDLVAVMQTLVQQRRFHTAPTLPEAALLSRELQAFKVKVNAATGNETFESWRERDHDDLVLSVACACWYAAGRAPQPAGVPYVISTGGVGAGHMPGGW
jgi:hypothetical protein